ncbi:MAG TPA: MarR family winged helix-turn-helix transcriptional regulator [Steroidobacteraceae bacterium]|nr:MarR family winged helix-turn-helix transcriptional regulator [Steroidobacteraceae bacterium]
MNRRGGVRADPGTAAQAPEEGLSVGYLMGRARASLLSGLDTELAQFGLSGMQFAVLKHLGDGSARTAADLCRFMHYDASSMTRILDRLELKGLVRRERSREDRRTVVLRLAPSGRAQIPRLAAVAGRVLETHLAGFRHEEVEALKGYLGRMIDNGRNPGDNRNPATGGKS